MIQQQRRFEVERRAEAEAPGVSEAISRVAEASQNLLADRLDLIRVEVRTALDEKITAASEAGKSLGLAAAGAYVARAGWVVLMVGVTWWLSRATGIPGALAIVGGIHLLAGLAMLAAAQSKRKQAARAASGQMRAEAAHRREPAELR
ncbi:MAG: phage holin family protein [Planctomycetes bacterium]|nr:phage holin family protein [Planctomycetota bacterium]